MLLTPESFLLSCGCGRAHGVLLQAALIERGALARLPEMRRATGLVGSATAVYDENTWRVTEGRRPEAGQEIILKAQGLHADEHGVQALSEQLAPGCEVLVAVGAGTIHDIVRYVAAQHALPFISVPTAASVDGFVSSVAAMTWHGFKKTLPAASPPLLVADLDIIAAAPWQLTCSGVGDVLGKYISLADWAIAALLTGEYYCDGIAALTRSAADEVTACHAQLAGGGHAPYTSLMKALLFSGVAMQLAGNSRPASGAEHHISHLIEMGVPWLPDTDALHGEKVGVGTLLCAREYRRLAALSPAALAAKNPDESLRTRPGPPEDALCAAFGPLADEVIQENRQNCLAPLPPGALLQRWEEVRAILHGIPAPEQLEAILRTLGAKRTLAGLGIGEEHAGDILRFSPYVRNRLTLMRIAGALAL